jgi:predicted AlkP superfamily phosphohydrolase/phosphomutase
VELQFPAAGIEINLRGRQPQGIVEAGAEYEALRSGILRSLGALADPEDGRPLVREAYRREDVYSGAFLEEMPDIVMLVDPAYSAGAGLDDLINEVPHSLISRISGDHLMDGVLIMRGDGVVRCGQRLDRPEIVDLAPTILYSMGCPIPEDMDGRVLEEALEPDLLAQQPPVTGDPLGQPASAAEALDVYSEDDEEGVRKALEGLGYL